MCARLDFQTGLFDGVLSDLTGQSASGLAIEENKDLRPADPLAVIRRNGEDTELVKARWGIQPSWSDRLLINARSETLLEKSTFRQAFLAQRCLVPCTGWYEWRSESAEPSDPDQADSDPGKQVKVRYRFSGENMPLYMAGLWFEDGSDTDIVRIVTLTTAPSTSYQPYHDRMPLIVSDDALSFWLFSEGQALFSMLPELAIGEFLTERVHSPVGNRTVAQDNQFQLGF